MIASVTGIGWVTAAGTGCGRDHDRFVMADGQLPELTGKMVFGKRNPRFGRMDQYSRLGVAAIAFALRDAGLEEWTVKRHIGIIVSTVYGCLHTDMDYFETVMPHEEGVMPSPHLFAYTLPSCFLGEAAIRFGLTGESFAVNDPSPRGLAGMRMSLDSIACGEMDKMLCGVCDANCPPIFAGTEGNNFRPLPAAGVTGALFFMIEKDPETNLPPYGELDLNDKGDILFNKTETGSLESLVHGCLMLDA